MTRLTWENVCSEAARGANPERPLTHSLDLGEEGLAMHATRTCSIDDCTRPHKGRGYCKLHLQRIWRQGDPHKVGVPRSPGGPLHHNWSGDGITYRGAHLRVERRRGRASAHPCLRRCGTPAAHWAYDNADPTELRHTDGRRYSTDPDHYLPLCVPCHSEHDAAARAAS